MGRFVEQEIIQVIFHIQTSCLARITRVWGVKVQNVIIKKSKCKM
jgi:hypothetical protein